MASHQEPEFKVENVVASVTLDQRIDLKKILEKFPHTEYNPKRFPGLIYKLKSPKTAILVFGSGKMVVTGAKTERKVFEAVKAIVKNLEAKKILNKPEANVKIQNVVASGDLFGEIDLERAALDLDFSMYEPEEFPGLIYTMKEPKVVILLFASGKIVVTGARRETDVFKAVKTLDKELREKTLIIRL